MEFIEAPAFSRYVSDYLADEEYRELQGRLALNPELGDLIPGTGGVRKLRWADPRRRKGRRGGLRNIYYYIIGEQKVWLITIYAKNKATHLSPKKKKAIRSALETES